MKLTSSAVTGTATTKFQGRVMKLFLVLAITANSVSAALTKLAASTMKVERTHATTYGTDTVIYATPLNYLLEMAACNEGSVRITSNGDNSVHTIKGTIELSDSGAIVTQSQEDYHITTTLDSGVTCLIYTIDSEVNAVSRLSYETARVTTGSPVTVNTNGCKFLAMPKSVITSLEFLYKDGQRIKLLTEELEQMLNEANPVSYEINGLITSGSKDLLVWNMSRINSVIIEQSADGNVYKMTDKFI